MTKVSVPWRGWVLLATAVSASSCVDMSVEPRDLACGPSVSRAGAGGAGADGGGGAGGQGTAGVGATAGPSSGAAATSGGTAGAAGSPTGGAAGTSGAGDTRAATAGAGGCPGTGGPGMVALPEGYCIDSTEVTRAQYAAWLDSGPSTDAQGSVCTWNTSFEPTATCINWLDVCRGDCDDHPQVCVDWCDATAYCQSMGKRLCGKIGPGYSTWADYDDTNLSEWFNACTSHGSSAYPYGSAYDGDACNGSDFEGARRPTLAVATLEQCQSTEPGYAGVFDLAGNVAEWDNICSGVGPRAFCRIRGGSFRTGSNLGCALSLFHYRSHVSESIGFRCCWSP